jgi:hypothetical protein
VLEEAMLIDEDSKLYFGINASGNLLWSAITEATELGSLTDLLATEFGLPDDRAWTDVVQFVTELERDGLVVVTEGIGDERF